jgi:hypothetical protein
MKFSLTRKKNYQGTHLGDQRPPDYVGDGGEVWRVLMKPFNERVNKTWDATLGIWFIYAPGVNATCPYFVALLLHLRSTDGHPEPHKETSKSAYEFGLFMLDPENVLPDLALVEAGDDREGPQVTTLEPSEFIAQFPDVGGDVRARMMINEMMQDIARGDLIPVESHRVIWAQALVQKVNEYQATSFQKRGES